MECRRGSEMAWVGSVCTLFLDFWLDGYINRQILVKNNSVDWEIINTVSLNKVKTLEVSVAAGPSWFRNAGSNW